MKDKAVYQHFKFLNGIKQLTYTKPREDAPIYYYSVYGKLTIEITDLTNSFHTNFTCGVGYGNISFKVKTGVKQG